MPPIPSRGEVSELAQRLWRCGRARWAAGIAMAQPACGKHVAILAPRCKRYVEARGFSVVRDLCGHGVGPHLHEKPKIPNYPTIPAMAENAKLQVGMALAIEPMVNAGRPEVEIIQSDGWTFETVDTIPFRAL